MARRQRGRREQARERSLGLRPSLVTGATVSAGALLGISSVAAAADVQVDNMSDNGLLASCTTAPNDCSLRGAVTYANSGGDAIDNITFQSGISGTIALTGGELTILDGTYVIGPGANVLSISGSGSSRIFYADPTTDGQPFGIYDLSLVNGHPPSGGGGAVFNRDAVLKIVGSTLSGNTAAGGGGAIYEKGVHNHGNNDYIKDSTISDNTAGHGGGLYGQYGVGAIVSSTISGNHATAGRGGGVDSFYGSAFYDSTVAANSAFTTGGGISVTGSGQSDGLLDSIVSGNSAGTSNPDLFGTFLTGFSLIQNPAGATVTPVVPGSNITGADPQLGNLANNGGPTPTQVPGPTSPVLDQGHKVDPSTEDQRGLTRPVDLPGIANSGATGADGSDMGAVEVQSLPIAPATPPPATKKKCKKKKHKSSAQIAKKKCKKKK